MSQALCPMRRANYFNSCPNSVRRHPYPTLQMRELTSREIGSLASGYTGGKRKSQG